MSESDSPSPPNRVGSIFGGGSSIFNKARRDPDSGPSGSRSEAPAPAAAAASAASTGGSPEKPATVSISVRDGTNEVSFKMRRDRPLEKLMNAASGHYGKSMNDCRFLFDGVRLKPDDTPDKLDMEEGDIIELFTEQIGGN